MLFSLKRYCPCIVLSVHFPSEAEGEWQTEGRTFRCPHQLLSWGHVFGEEIRFDVIMVRIATEPIALQDGTSRSDGMLPPVVSLT